MVSITRDDLEAQQAPAARSPGAATPGERDFSRALLESMSDGVVACDAQGVLTLFNRAAREWHGEDARRLPTEAWPSHYGLFRADGVTPLPPGEVPLARALRGEPVVDEGMAIGVPGRPVRHVVANGSAIVDAAGRKLGAVVVMRDVTELRRVEAELRRATEELLRQSEERYRLIFDNVLDALYLLEVLPDGRFRTLEVNPALERLTGIPRARSVGKTQEESVDAETARLVNAKYRRCVEQGRPIDEEVVLELPAGRRYFHSTLIPTRGPEGAISRIIGISRDVTDLRRTGAINAARLHLMQFAADHSLDEVLEETLNEVERLSGSLVGFFHFVDEDQAALTLQAWSTRTKAELRKAVEKGLHYPVADAGLWADCVRQRRPVIHNDVASLPHREGTPAGLAEVERELVVPVKRGERIVAIVGVGNKPADYDADDVEAASLLADLAWEISERKRAEESLRRLNRQLRAISECNQTLMRATDEQALLDDVCRIVHERAGYQMVRVGFTADDAVRSIHPAASAGADERDGADARPSWGAAELGRGPAGDAVRSGRTVAVQDLARCPELAPWLEDWGRRGLRSALWLPLQDQRGGVFGVLLIASSEVDAFSREEVALLEELARNLAFGVSVLRGRAKQKAAERSVAVLSFALNSVRESVFLIDEHGGFRYVNDAAGRLLGYGPGELLQRSVADVDPEFPQGRWPAHWRELREKRSLLFEGRHRTREGRVFPVEISSNYFEYEGQAYSLALVHDITERKRTEEALRTSDRRYRMAQAIGHVGNWEYDFQTGQLWGSDEAKRIYGLDPAQAHFSTEEVERCIPERERVRQALIDLVERGAPYSLEFEIHPRDGSPPRIIASIADLQRDDQGAPLRVSGVVHDITQRRRAEAELRASEQNLALHVQQTPLGVIEWDLGFRVTKWNPAAERIFGYPRSEALGKHGSLLVPPAAQGPVAETWEALLQGRGGLRSTNENVTRDGKHISCEWYNTPLVDGRGKVVAVASLVQDVTERRRLEEQLRQAQKMEAIGTLAGGVAHDFNNILTAIIGYGKLMEKDGASDDPNQPLVREILAAAERATQVTRGLLAFSRKQLLHPQPVDLNEIIRSVERFLRRLIGEDIELSTTLEPGELVAMADAGQIEQVLMNLATNARDAMPAGGLLAMATRTLRVDEDHARAHGLDRPGKYAEIAVSDTGEGMDEKTREKVFEPFFTTKGVGKGTGLGLAIVYGIVKQHAGNVDAYSEPGHGTTFKILLPLVDQSPGKEPERPPQPPPRGTETILLAEDDPAVRRVIGTVLREHGYQVIEAVDGAEALERFTARRAGIDLLILDVIMPRMNGREVHDAVAAARPGLPTLFISGYTGDVIDRKGIRDEGLEFISKPMRPADLLAKVRSVLDKPRG